MLLKDDIPHLDERFDHHPPENDMVVALHARARVVMKRTARDLELLSGFGRENALMLKALEEALMWCNKAIALDQGHGVRKAELVKCDWTELGRTECPHCGISAHFSWNDSFPVFHLCGLCRKPYVVVQ